MVRPDYFDDYRNLPEYTDTMFLEGFTPQQILTAAHRTMLANLQPEGEEVGVESEVIVS